ncbi:MAG: ABC transporter transmembrane domain-containing protein [Solirubrobacteraceae bacterium]
MLGQVASSSAEEREIARLHGAAERAYRFGMRAAGAQAVVWVLISLSVQVAVLVVLGVGGARVAAGSMNVADLIALLLYLFYLTGPVTELAMGATQLQSGLAAVRRLGEIDVLAIEEPGPRVDAAPPRGRSRRTVRSWSSTRCASATAPPTRACCTASTSRSPPAA